MWYGGGNKARLRQPEEGCRNRAPLYVLLLVFLLRNNSICISLVVDSEACIGAVLG